MRASAELGQVGYRDNQGVKLTLARAVSLAAVTCHLLMAVAETAGCHPIDLMEANRHVSA